MQGRCKERSWLFVCNEPVPDPRFGELAIVPSTAITIGQSVRVDVSVLNAGGGSDDGRIVLGFPGLTAAGDSAWVSGAGDGDTPGYREHPAGAALASATCRPVTASYLTAELADDDWLGHSGETNRLVVDIRPQAIGVLRIEVRATLRTLGGGPCEYVSRIVGTGASTPAYGTSAV